MFDLYGLLILFWAFLFLSLWVVPVWLLALGVVGLVSRDGIGSGLWAMVSLPACYVVAVVAALSLGEVEHPFQMAGVVIGGLALGVGLAGRMLRGGR